MKTTATNGGSGQATMITTEPQLSFIAQEEFPHDPTTLSIQGNYGYALLSSN